MTTIRVDAYPGSLDSVQVRTYGSPYTLLETITSASINEVVGGVYELTSALTTGNWMLVLLDTNSDTLGVKYANPDFLQAADHAPWLADFSSVLDEPNSDHLTPGTIGYNIQQAASGTGSAISSVLAVPVEENYRRKRLKFHNGETTTIRIELLDADEEPVDYTGVELDFVIEDEDKTSLVEVLGNTGADGYVDVILPPIAHQTTNKFQWSIRRADTGYIAGFGPAIYEYAPLKS